MQLGIGEFARRIAFVVRGDLDGHSPHSVAHGLREAARSRTADVSGGGIKESARDPESCVAPQRILAMRVTEGLVP
jgi:hypothetical protein